MSHIVKIINNQAITTSLDIAQGTQTEHRVVLQLIKNYQTKFLQFGKLIFEFKMRHKQGNHTIVYQLNEAQATLLLTMIENTPKVLDFKMALVKAFFRARALLQTDTMHLLYKHALLCMMLANEKRQASSYGRGLAQWKKRKGNLQTDIDKVECQLQLDFS